MVASSLDSRYLHSKYSNFHAKLFTHFFLLIYISHSPNHLSHSFQLPKKATSSKTWHLPFVSEPSFFNSCFWFSPFWTPVCKQVSLNWHWTTMHLHVLICSILSRKKWNVQCSRILATPPWLFGYISMTALFRSIMLFIDELHRIFCFSSCNIFQWSLFFRSFKLLQYTLQYYRIYRNLREPYLIYWIMHAGMWWVSFARWYNHTNRGEESFPQHTLLKGFQNYWQNQEQSRIRVPWNCLLCRYSHNCSKRCCDSGTN